MARSRGLIVRSPDEMNLLGRAIGCRLFDGAVVGLSGVLGAGKTILAAGIAQGMGIDEGYRVSSPTYTLMQCYPCSGRTMTHLDLYRIGSPEDLDSTGYRDFVGGRSVLVVEWPEREPSVLPAQNLVVLIGYGEDNGRIVSLAPSGAPYEELADEVLKLFEEAGMGPLPD